MVQPNATPIAHYSPVPISLYWQTTVKKDMEQDIALAMIKPAPVKEPITSATE